MKTIYINSTNINDVYALIKIIKEFGFYTYDEYVREFKLLIEKEPKKFNNCTAYEKLKNTVNNSLFNRPYKSFVEKYAGIISILKEYDCLYDLTPQIKEATSEDSLENIYNYLKEHPQDLNKVLENIGTIEQLGINNIKYSEKLDFTKKEYSYDTPKSSSCIFGETFTLVDNMEIKPKYNDSSITYITKSSPYLLELETTKEDEEIIVKKYVHNNCIQLNSLVFDKKLLPKKIDKEYTLKLLFDRYEETKETRKTLKEDVSVKISIKDLKDAFKSLKNSLSKIEDEQIRKKYIDQFEAIYNLFTELDEDFDQKVKVDCSTSSVLTPEEIDSSAKTYIYWREISKYLD